MHLFWSPPNLNLTLPENVAKALLECPADFTSSSLSTPAVAAQSGQGEKKLFTKQQVEEIIKGTETPQVKEALKKATQEALDKGAFGNPWFWVTADDKKEKGEPFFGSDRYVKFLFLFVASRCLWQDLKGVWLVWVDTDDVWQIPFHLQVPWSALPGRHTFASWW